MKPDRLRSRWRWRAPRLRPCRPALPHRRPGPDRHRPLGDLRVRYRRRTHVRVDVDAASTSTTVPIKDVQLTATLPLSFSTSRHRGWRGGTGDVELGVKYRFFKDDRSHFWPRSFPRPCFPPRASHHKRTRFRLPIWMGKDFKRGASIFGGGGYNVNPGRGNRDFWQAEITFTRRHRKFSLGAEIMQQGSDSVGGTAKTERDVGSIVRLSKNYGILVSAGPTWADHRTGYHFYAALGLFY